MNCIPIPTDLAFTLLDEASRRRALTDDESLLLEQIVTRGHQTRGIRITWTPKLERELWKASYRKGTIQSFADANGMSYKAAHEHLRKMRARKADKTRKGEKG